MLYGSVIYNTLLSKIRKDARGLSLSIDEFNLAAVVVNQRVMDRYYADFEDSLDVSNNLGSLKKFDTALTLVSGVTTLPFDYYSLIGLPYYYDSGGVRRNIDIISSLEYSNREGDYLTKATLKHPTCVIGGDGSNDTTQIHFYPTTLSTVYINYLRVTDAPFLDYYVNTDTLEYTFLAANAQNVSIVDPYVYRDGTTGTKNSQTIEWEWGSGDLPFIVSLFLQEMGITLPDEGLLIAGQNEENKILSE